MSALLEAVGKLASPWAYVVIGLLAAAESAAFIGLVIPGEAALLLGGFLAFQGQVNVVVMAVVAAAGAIIGDSVGYEIGRKVGAPLRSSRLGRRVGEQRWDRGERYLTEKGGRAVFFGRWVGLLRALVPTLAGMGRLPYRTFLPFNVLGGLTWAPTFVFLGYLAGGSYQKVEKFAGRATLLLLVVVVVVGGVVLAARWVTRRPDRVRQFGMRQLDRPALRRWRTRHARLFGFLEARFTPGGRFGLSLTLGLLLVAGLGWVLGELLDQVLEGGGLAGVDRPVLTFVVGHRSAWLTDVARVVTAVGSPVGLAITAAVVAGMLAWRRRSLRPLLLAAAVVIGVELLETMVKLLVGRPRPPSEFAVPGITAGGYAFPSGHASQSAAIYGVLAVLLVGQLRGWGSKVAVWTSMVLAAAAVGFSRLYLGVHWLTDVLAAWALGLGWLLVVLTAAGTLTAVRQPPRPAAASPQAAVKPHPGSHRRRPPISVGRSAAGPPSDFPGAAAVAGTDPDQRPQGVAEQAHLADGSPSATGAEPDSSGPHDCVFADRAVSLAERRLSRGRAAGITGEAPAGSRPILDKE